MKLTPSFTLYTKQVKMERLLAGKYVYDFGLGESPVVPPEILQETLIKYSHVNEYTNTKGIKELQELLGSKLILGNGLKPLLYLCQKSFHLMYPDRSIFHILPAWLSYQQQAKTITENFVGINCKKENKWKLQPEQLEEHLSKAKKGSLLIFNNPVNPTGDIYTKKEIEQFIPILEKYETIVLNDSIYCDLIYPSYEESFGDISEMYSKTIIGYSLSKFYSSGGYRFGWLKFPDHTNDLDDFYQQCSSFSSIMYSCTSPVFQYVTIEALKIPKHKLKFQNKILEDLSKQITKKLNKMKVNFTIPKAAWYIWVDFTDVLKDKYKNSEDLALTLCEEIGFITVPGSSFTGNNRLELRLSLVDFTINKCKYDYSKVLKGIDVLGEWLDINK